jgi:hypothetical protein
MHLRLSASCGPAFTNRLAWKRLDVLVRGGLEPKHIEPNLIVVEANVRTEATLPGSDNRAGQRRTRAAREAGLITIAACIFQADEATTDRIVQPM